MQFGIFGGAGVGPGSGPDVDSGHPYQDYLDYVIEAEALGYCSAFCVEHHFTGTGELSASLNLLTWLGALTKTIRLGTAVVVLPWHNPVILAEQVATLDLLSGGRVDFGVGKGYRHNEFSGFGVPMEESAGRFDEALEIILKGWTSRERFSHRGRYWTLEEILIDPPVAQKPHPPVWIGAGNPASIAAVAERGHNLLLDQFATIEVIGERIAIFRAEVEKRGRRFDPRTVAVARSVYVSRDRADTEEALDRRLVAQERLRANAQGAGKVNTSSIMSFSNTREASADAALYGSPEEIAAKVERLRGLGAEYLLMVGGNRSRDNLSRFAGEVMAHYLSPPAAAGAGRAAGMEAKGLS